MNPGLLTLNLMTGGSSKKLITLVLSTMAVILALPFLAVISLGSEPLSFLANAPSAQAAETQGFYMGGAVPDDTYEWGNCTYWSFAMRLWAGSPIPTSWGNANTWDDRAIRDGYVVNHLPKIGSIFQSDRGQFGHVAYVIAVNEFTGDWTISEMNRTTLNVVGTRTFSKDDAGSFNFIHEKKGVAPWTPLPILNQLPAGGSLLPRY